MNTEQLELKRSSLAHGLAFLGSLLLSRNGNLHGGNGLSGEEAEQCGCLLLCLSDYAQSLEAQQSLGLEG